jgi:hypothetical protein
MTQFWGVAPFRVYICVQVAEQLIAVSVAKWFVTLHLINEDISHGSCNLDLFSFSHVVSANKQRKGGDVGSFLSLLAIVVTQHLPHEVFQITDMPETHLSGFGRLSEHPFALLWLKVSLSFVPSNRTRSRDVLARKHAEFYSEHEGLANQQLPSSIIGKSLQLFTLKNCCLFH